MSDNSKAMCDQAIEFVGTFFEIYLEQRDFDKAFGMFDENITWIGTGAHEICNGSEDAAALFEAEKNSWDGHFKIIDKWYKALPAGENNFAVYGELKIIEDGLNTILLDMDSRVSMVCRFDNGQFTILHAHFSVPNAAQKEDEFVHKSLIKDYNQLLEQKLIERTKLLQDKTAELEALANNICGGVEICTIDDDFTIEYVSDGFQELTGYSRDDVVSILQSKHIRLIFPQDALNIRGELEKQLAISDGYTMEYRVVRKDGRIIWVLDKGVIIPSNDQKRRFQCILTDITQQKEQEALLEQKSFELETITNNVQAAIIRCLYTKGMPLTYANDGLFRMLGYTREQFCEEKGNLLSCVVHPDDLAVLYQNIIGQLDFGNTTVYENRLVRRDGGMVWVLSKGVVSKDESGVLEFNGVLTDITEQKKVEEDLRVSQKRYEIAMGFSDVTMFEYNVQNESLILFERDADMYGVSQVIPNGVETFVNTGIVEPEYVDGFREMYQKIHDGATSAQCYINTKDKTGLIHEYQLSLTNMFDSAGKPLRAIGVRKNVTQLRNLEKEKKYGTTMTADRLLIYEVNLSKDKVISCNEQWAKASGIWGVSSFTKVKERVCEMTIAPEFRETLMQKLSYQNLVAEYESGQKQVSFEYRKTMPDGSLRWFKQTVTIIQDDFTGEFNVRGYLMDINDKKNRELRLAEEQRQYEAMVSKSIAVYNVNLSQNLLLNGHESFEGMFGMKQNLEFSELIYKIGSTDIYPDDRELFYNSLLTDNLLRAYSEGKSELITEYRRLCNGKLLWVSTTVHLFEDAAQGEVKAFIFVEDINERKLEALDMLYKSEHDHLTDFFNKSSTEKHVNACIASSKGTGGAHAFLIIDIDYFKAVNDNFGHPFGDIVLSNTASKIRALIADKGIMGRIGGDEFCVFLKDAEHEEEALSQAGKICGLVSDTFAKNGIEYKISASIGIAFCPEHGSDYSALFQRADIALYAAKQGGRNRYTVYTPEMTL